MIETVRSDAWTAARPEVSVIVSTINRAHYLPGLLAALEAQVDAPSYEVVIADDASTDGTWAALGELAAKTPLPLTALRLPENLGAGRARNRCVAQSRGAVLAITDDDCLPAPEWLRWLTAPFGEPRVDVVQGRTVPEPGEPPGPWARSLWVLAPTPWLETCNLGYRRSAYEAVGGFDELDPVFGRSGKGFGEDTWLGARVLERGGRRVFVHDAVVHHRWREGTFADHVRERALMRDFPWLARKVPSIASSLWGGVFLSRRTAAVDAAVVSTVAAVGLRRPVLMVGVLPWLREAWGPARDRRGPLPLRLAQGAVADVAGLAALVEGSARHRRLVL